MKEQLRKEIGMRIRKIRKALGYTQEQMVSYFDIGRANYSRIEKGEIFPRSAILDTLKTQFNVSLDWLVTNVGEMFVREQEEKKETVSFEGYDEETRDMLFHMAKIPMLKHAMLAFFMEYKAKNKERFDEIASLESVGNSGLKK